MNHIFIRVIIACLITLLLSGIYGCTDKNQSDIPTVSEIPEDTTEAPVWEIHIEKAHDVLQGHYQDIAVTMSLDSVPMVFFDFLIGYDAQVMTLADVRMGEFLEECGWEYFTYRCGVIGNCDDCPSGLIRLVGYAETNNGGIHPDYECLSLAQNSEIAVVTFFISNDRQYECSFHPISFFWFECNDNSMFTVDGDTMAISRRVYDHNDSLISNYTSGIPGYVGVPDSCAQDPRWTTLRYIDFHNGSIDIVCSDSIDSPRRGDLNCNGLSGEIIDAIIFSNYFINGLSAFGYHTECSIAASEVNGDGIELTLADFVFLVRVIFGEFVPYPPDTDAVAEVYYDDGSLGIASSENIGAALFVFRIDGDLGAFILHADNMDIKYAEKDNELRVLLYSIGSEYIPAGSRLILDVDSNAILLSAELATYEGGMVQTTIHTQ